MTVNFLEQRRAAVAARKTERDALKTETETLLSVPTTENRGLNADEKTTLTALVERSKALEDADAEDLAEIAELEKIERAMRGPAVHFVKPAPEVGPTEVRSLDRSQARDAALRRLDECEDTVRAETIDKMVRRRSPLGEDGHRNFDGDQIARMLLVTEHPAYRSAFYKAITTPTPAWEPHEIRALNEMRSMQAYTNAGGGFGVPVFIDPTFIITTSTLASPLIAVSRVENITTTAWKGISTAAAAWSFDAESAAVSDDSLTLAQPSVTAHMARGFIPFSMEFEDDYPNGAGELSNALEVGYMDLLASKLVSGSGTAEPWGIEDALDANTNVEVTPTTDGSFGAVDIDKVWKELGERWRARATWLMHVDVENEIRGFGSGTATSRFTVDQTREGISLLNGRPVILSDYMPQFSGTTGASNILIVGDFKQFLIAQRLGMTVELVSHLVDVTNNRPTGERGWFARARIGSDSVLDTAFRILQNQ